MNFDHKHTLATLEQRGLDVGMTIDELDGYIARELHVPVDHYQAYLLVWAALDAYQTTQHRPEGRPGDPGVSVHTPISALLRRLWESAGVLHEAAVNSEPSEAVRTKAHQLLLILLDLSERLVSPDQSSFATAQSSRGGGC